MASLRASKWRNAIFVQVALVGNGVLDLAVALVPGLAQNGIGKAFNPWLRSFGESRKTALATEVG